jgi:hypothetical protein
MQQDVDLGGWFPNAFLDTFKQLSKFKLFLERKSLVVGITK